MAQFWEHQPAFMIGLFVNAIIANGDWCELKFSIAVKLITSRIDRRFRAHLITFLLTYLRKVPEARKQQDVLGLFPSGLTVDGELMMEVTNLEMEAKTSPIQKEERKSTTFIWTPSKFGVEKIVNLCSSGEDVCFRLSLKNSLSVPVAVDMLRLLVTNGTAYPIRTVLPRWRPVDLHLMVKAGSEGILAVNGLRFISGHITGEYILPSPLEIEVVQKIPLLSVKLPNTFAASQIENSHMKLEFELLNTSEVSVQLDGIVFGPIPPLFSPTSLQVDWPPPTEPAFPRALGAGSGHRFTVSYRVDRTITQMAFAIGYRTNEGSSRCFEFSREFQIVEGPHIDGIEVISLDSHDDFVSKTVTIMIVIANPLDTPISVTCSGAEAALPIDPKECGMMIIDIDRVDLRTFEINDDSADLQIRRSEALAESELNARLEQSEKDMLSSIVHVKTELQRRVSLQWNARAGVSGSLPFNHVIFDSETLMLLKPVPFSVEFGLMKITENIWQIQCDIGCEEKLILIVHITFRLQNDGDDFLLASGAEETEIETPGSVIRAIHCMPEQNVLVTGRFSMNGAHFIRNCMFFVE
jgi:hypothetical protein